jgi:hypothetical protein
VQGQYDCLNFHDKRVGQGAKHIVAVKNKWVGAWTRAWFYFKVPLLHSPSPVRGKGIYALHSYMAALDFATELSFECSDDDASDVDFVKATRSISRWDTIEEYTAYGLFPLAASFGLGEIADRKTPVLKIHLPLLEFPIAKLVDEIDDCFCATVELAAECLATVPNRGRLNRVFEQGGVPYGPHLEPGFEAIKEATRKRKDDASPGPMGKRVKVSRRKTAPKAPVTPKSTGVTLLKVASSKAVPSQMKSVSKAGAMPRAIVPLQACVPTKATMLKSMTTPGAPIAEVLKISVGVKRGSAESLVALKGK